MEFRYDLRKLLPQEITFVDNTLIVKGWQSTTRNRSEYQQLFEIINVIGEASAFAQGLNRVITSSEKMLNTDHFLYLMKEEERESGRVVLVGMLKIGRKKLFLLNQNKQTKEVAPLCVLDFYIHESRQRRGYGRRMFDYMLKHQNIDPGHMAVDKPSDKFIFFLKKHYGLVSQIPQVNNFIVYEEFFKERPVTSQEAALTYVNRSNRSSRNTSPDRSNSPCSQRGSVSSAAPSGYAGKPSRYKESSMSDILHGKVESYHPSIRVGPKQQTTLDWMRGSSGRTESPYASALYSSSRTPSYGGSPITRTPKDTSPTRSYPPTPPRGYPAVVASQKQNVQLIDTIDGIEGSFAPTPATSPNQRRHEGENGDSGDVDYVCEKAEELSVQDLDEVSWGKTGVWRDNVSRDPEGLVEHMSAGKGTTMTGVLTDNESVHGHLKFHHHALW